MILERQKMAAEGEGVIDTARWVFPEHHKEFWKEFLMCAREGMALTVDSAQQWWESAGVGAGVLKRSHFGYDPVPSHEPSGSYGSGSGGSGSGSYGLGVGGGVDGSGLVENGGGDDLDDL